MVRLNTPQGAPGLFFVDFQLWQRHAAARDFVYRSPAGEIAARLMGSREVVYYHDHLLVKEPGRANAHPGITTSPIIRSTASRSSRCGCRSTRSIARPAWST
jgi:hypothetical protein